MRGLGAALVCVSVMAGTACQATTPASPTSPSGSPSAAVSTYLDGIIDLARNNSINRLTIDWAAYRNAVFAEAGRAQTIAELAPAIRVAITLLRDGHSSYRSATGSTIFVALRSCSAPAPATLSLPPNIGSVAVGAFSGTTEQANAYARQTQDAIDDVGDGRSIEDPVGDSIPPDEVIADPAQTIQRAIAWLQTGS